MPIRTLAYAEKKWKNRYKGKVNNAGQQEAELQESNFSEPDS